MATASKTAVTTVETKYTLTLSEDEADFLSAIMARIGGDYIRSPRVHQVNIRTALDEAGVPFYSETTSYHLMDEGRIRFRDYPAGKS